MTPVRAALAAVLATALLAVSGCGVTVAGADGDLVDDWRPLAAPAFDLPAAGTCVDRPASATFNPLALHGSTVGCDSGHTSEVVTVAAVEAGAAQASEAPARTSEAFRAAYVACGKAVSDYVGGDWHTGMLGIDLQMPARPPWEGGLRSSVCSVHQLSDIYGRTARSTVSLKGALSGAAPKALRCFDVNGDKDGSWWGQIRAITPIDCAQPHEAEFVGTVQVGVGAGGPLPTTAQLKEWTSDRCWSAAAAYLGLTVAQLDARDDVGVAWDGFDEDEWQAGERTQRCLALFDPGKKARASVKGLGKRPLPV